MKKKSDDVALAV